MFKKNNEKTITITREELRDKFMEVLSDPFGDKDIPEDHKVQMQMGAMLNGILIMKRLEEELFGKEE